MLILEPSKRFHAIRLEKHEWFDNVRNDEKKRKQKLENKQEKEGEGQSLGDGSILDTKKWNEYLEIMKLCMDDNDDSPQTPSCKINIETIKMGLIASTIKCKNKKITEGIDDDDITLSVCDCNDCNHNHQKVMFDAFEGNGNNDDYKWNDKKPNKLNFGSRRILSNSDNEDSENEDEDEDIDIEYYRKKQFEKNKNVNNGLDAKCNKIRNKRKRSRREYEDEDDIKQDIGNVAKKSKI